MIKKLCSLCLIMIFILSAESSFAAFPVKQQNRPIGQVIEPSHHIDAAPLLAPARHDSHGDGGIYGIISFCLGITGLASYVASLAALEAAFETSSSLTFFLVGFFLGIGAMILGFKGHRKRNKGFAIAGAVLGIVEVSIAVVVGIIAVLLASILGGF